MGEPHKGYCPWDVSVSTAVCKGYWHCPKTKTLIRYMKVEDIFRKEENSICIDRDYLDKILKLGIDTFKVYMTDTLEIYWISWEDFEEFSSPIEYPGYSPQWAVPKEVWSKLDAPPTREESNGYPS